ncbi:MAG TPA: class I SAM-dependent methyltransferase [Tepidisphaeraceae bacterium]|jgi:SAM-dependent methyltransferase
MKSYTAVRLGLRGRLNEFRALCREHLAHSGQRVRALIAEAIKIEELGFGAGSPPLRSARVLEIGPGQCPAQLAYFARNNDAIGIDMDIIPWRLGFRDCVRVFQRNGAIRTLKTVGRKLLGIDALLASEIRDQLNGIRVQDLNFAEMDAAQLSFPSASFDLVYLRAVFEHLPDPAAVLAEIRRVLKANGALVILLHLYTSYSGCHDARILTGNKERLPLWPHLRPQHQHLVQENAYLNKLRLSEWRALFASAWPDCVVTATRDSGPDLVAALGQLKTDGELGEFSDEELLTITLQVCRPGKHDL